MVLFKVWKFVVCADSFEAMSSKDLKTFWLNMAALASKVMNHSLIKLFFMCNRLAMPFMLLSMESLSVSGGNHFFSKNWILLDCHNLVIYSFENL